MQPEWFDGLTNKNLTWEETKQYDFGIDLDFFDHRVSLTMDYYYRLTDKLLYNITLPGNYSGYDRQWQNAYAIMNEGLEIQVKWDYFSGREVVMEYDVQYCTELEPFEEKYERDGFPKTGTGVIISRTT